MAAVTKRERNTTAATAKLMMVADSFYIPKDKPLKPNGEDAHFFHKAAQVIGVADGVGSWSRKGVDAGEYARALMGNAEYSVYNRRPSDVDPKQLLLEAFHNITTTTRGSATACIISLAGENLVAANLGDSGFMVMRGGKTIYKSPVQQQGFNCPYQLGELSRISPEAADVLTVKVKGGDIVVAATDGLFDNLFLNEIESIVNDCVNWKNLPEDLARAALHKTSPMSNASSPYREQAAAHQRSSTANTAAAFHESVAARWSSLQRSAASVQLKSSPTNITHVAAGVKWPSRWRHAARGRYGDRIRHEEYSGDDVNYGKYDDITVVVARIVQECS